MSYPPFSVFPIHWASLRIGGRATIEFVGLSDYIPKTLLSSIYTPLIISNNYKKKC